MDKRKLFSVLFCSASMLLFFLGSIRDRTKSRRGLALLLQSFIRAPQIDKVKKIAPLRGHAYVIQLNRDMPSMSTGRSPLILAEDGIPLPHPDAESHDAVATLGMGRYFHFNRRVFFSPSDNADLRQQTRRYVLLETLTADRDKIDKLTDLNQRRRDFGNPGLWLLAKLAVYLDAKLQVGAAVPDGPDGMTVSDITIDTAALDFDRIHIDRAACRWHAAAGGWSRLDIDLDSIVTVWSERPWHLRLALDFTPECDLRLKAATLRAGDIDWADISLNWMDDGLDSGVAEFSDLAGFRAGLAAACGGAEGGRRWLGDMLAAVRKGDLSFGCVIDAATELGLSRLLAPESTAAGLRVTLQRRDGALTLQCAQA